jgi:hypothetical protein
LQKAETTGAGARLHAKAAAMAHLIKAQAGIAIVDAGDVSAAT